MICPDCKGKKGCQGFGFVAWYDCGVCKGAGSIDEDTSVDSIIKYDEGSGIPNAHGDKYWFLNGKLHREDGPAVEHSNGSKYWFLNGIPG